jgi:calnexin
MCGTQVRSICPYSYIVDSSFFILLLLLDAVKPADWDDEEDGEFEAPMVPNPKCTEGCGPWTQPRIKNPAHKGKWSAPMIDNPAYQGVWAAKKIPNPKYFLDNKPSDMAQIAGIAVEVWTTNAGIHFDNFIVATSLTEAFSFAESTFSPKAKLEEAHEKEVKRKAKDEADKKTISDKGWMGYFEVYVVNFMKENVFAVGAAVVVVSITMLYFVISSTTSHKEAPAVPIDNVDEGEGEHDNTEDEKEESASDAPKIPTTSSASSLEDEHEGSPATKSAPRSDE